MPPSNKSCKCEKLSFIPNFLNIRESFQERRIIELQSTIPLELNVDSFDSEDIIVEVEEQGTPPLELEYNFGKGVYLQ